ARAADAAPGTRPVDASAHATDQCIALAYGRAWHRCRSRSRGVEGAACDCCECEREQTFAGCQSELDVLAEQLQACQTLIGTLEKRIIRQHKSSDRSQRLETVPGIGGNGATRT